MSIDKGRSQQLFDKLDRLLARINAQPQPERVHQIRTSTRRVEALVDNLCPQPDRRLKKLKRRLKKLRRAAGQVRDVDVQIDALGTVKIGRDEERKKRLGEALSEMRAQREQAFAGTLEPKRVRKLRKGLRRTQELLRAGGAESADAGDVKANVGSRKPRASPCLLADEADFDPVAEALRKFAALSGKTKAFTAENLHAYRTECKRIRYIAEMAGDNARAKRAAQQLKRIQDAIGEWHDWLTLSQTADEVLGRGENALLAALRSTTHEKFLEARGITQQASRELQREYRELQAEGRRQRSASLAKKTVAGVATTQVREAAAG